tara:strand:+ start:133 stop:816 length:684 start_codon:yes stop_codon:yes gene_type:complete
MTTEKKYINTIRLSSDKLQKIEKKFLDSEFIIRPLENMEIFQDNPQQNSSDQILIISGEDFNLDLFKEHLKQAEKLEAKVLALPPLPDMDLLISNFSRPFFDFCLPPHDVNEISLRVINLSGKGDFRDNMLIKIGPLTINQESYEVSLEGEKLDLTFKEYELLKYLSAKPGRVFSRESLLHSVWEYDYYGGTRTVDVHIRRLRSKINNIKYNFIETVWNVGYRFKAI